GAQAAADLQFGIGQRRHECVQRLQRAVEARGLGVQQVQGLGDQGRVLAQGAQARLPVFGRRVADRIEQFPERLPACDFHVASQRRADGCQDSCRLSQALAKRRSRSTVGTDTPCTQAISSWRMPPKYAISKPRAARSSRTASRSSAWFSASTSNSTAAAPWRSACERVSIATSPPRFSAARARAWSTSTARIFSEAKAKKWARSSQSTSVPSIRSRASLTPAVGWRVWPAWPRGNRCEAMPRRVSYTSASNRSRDDSSPARQ